MFNTISKRCLLCLRLVSYGASLLWSGFIRGGVDRLLFVCLTQLVSLLLDCTLDEGVPLLLRAEAIHKCVYSTNASSRVFSPVR